MAENSAKAKTSITNNVLKIGISTLFELEDKVKAFRSINLNAKKKRFIISREDIKSDTGVAIVSKGEDIDLAKVKLMRRNLKGETIIKTFQPDEGIVLLTDMNSPTGIQLSMDMVTQIMNMGGGAYEAFIDRVDNFKEFSTLLNKALFPKLVVVGSLTTTNFQEEIRYIQLIRKIDPYMRMIEITHTELKPQAAIPKLKQIRISLQDKDSWKRFLLEIIQEYTKPYSIEET